MISHKIYEKYKSHKVVTSLNQVEVCINYTFSELETI